MRISPQTGETMSERTTTRTTAPPLIFIEAWAPEYGSPMQIDDEETSGGSASLIDDEGFSFVAPPSNVPKLLPLAFVDGIRRREAMLTQWIDESTILGIAGAYAVGSVLAIPGKTPTFGISHVERLLIWAGGHSGSLPSVAGWTWTTSTTPEGGPQAAERRLQEMMRHAEGRLAATLADEGYLVVTDGPLFYAAPHGKANLAGYVKTHHVRLLPEPEARRLPDLPAHCRTTLFRTNSNRYSCYLRLTPRAAQHAPMSGIVRLEFPGSLPLDEVRQMADLLTVELPRFAGVAHCDPRAPQNLQPIGALETRLRHLLGDAGLAERAVRDAVLLLHQ